MSENKGAKKRVSIDSILGSSKKQQESPPEQIQVRPPRDAGRRIPEKEPISFMLPLPISGVEIPAKHVYIDPEKCRVSPLNKRCQSLLSENDPTLIQLEKSIIGGKQRDPVLIRPLPNGEYELIYGSRRKFVVASINRKNKEHEKRLLSAWLADIPDGEISALADSENDDREAISIYERALYFQNLNKEKGWSEKLIAEHEKVSEATVRDSLKVARIPLAFVKLVDSPRKVNHKSGVKLLKLIDATAEDKLQAFLKATQQSSFSRMLDLHKALMGFVANKENKQSESVSSREPNYFNDPSGKNVRAKMIQHRKNKDQWKIDLYSMTENQIARVKSFLQEIALEGASKEDGNHQ